ncbi:MAG: hypothetical protein H7Z40_19330 [Phycisphaerae bacterium]|nr:hypothetical protein [Gemmatimonadaceae bacterium]
MSSITRYRRGIAVLVSLCASNASFAQSPASSVRDSAGIRIVENARPFWTARTAWTLSAKPVLLIGGRAEPGHSFARVGASTRLGDGRIVVAERAEMHLRIFDSTGRYQGTLGRKGQKPGEFPDIGMIARLPGDSLAVESVPYTSIFSPDGQFVRQVHYGPFAPGLLQVPFVAVIGRFPDGTAVVGDFPQGRRGGRGSARWVDSSTLLMVDASGAVTRKIDRVPAASFGASVNAPTPLTFGPELVHASAANHIYIGFGSEYAIRQYDARWTLRRIIRRSWTPRPLLATEITAYVDAWMTLWSTDTGPLRERDRLARLNATFPDSLPAFVDFLASPSGELWLRDADLAGAATCACLTSVSAAPSSWTVFAASGQWLGQVKMPKGFTPAEVGRDYVLGQTRDADGLLRLAMYRIIKPAE